MSTIKELLEVGKSTIYRVSQEPQESVFKKLGRKPKFDQRLRRRVLILAKKHRYFGTRHLSNEIGNGILIKLYGGF